MKKFKNKFNVTEKGNVIYTDNSEEHLITTYQISPKFNFESLTNEQLHTVNLDFTNLIGQIERASLMSIPQNISFEVVNDELENVLDDKYRELFEMEVRDRPEELITNIYYLSTFQNLDKVNVLQVLKSTRFFTLRQITANEYYELTSTILYGDELNDDILIDKTDYNSLFSKSGYKFYDKYYYQSKFNKYKTVMKSDDFNITQQVGWLHNFFNTNQLITKMDIQRLDSKKANKLLDTVVNNNYKNISVTTKTSEQIENKRNVQQAMAVIEDIKNEEDALYRTELKIYIESDTEEDVINKMDILQNFFRSFHLSAGVELMQDNFKQMLLIPYKLPKFTKPIPLSTLGQSTPVIFNSLHEKNGQFLSSDDTGYILLDQWMKTPERTNFSAVYVGNLGSGKSSAVKSKIQHEIIQKNHFVRLIPPSKEYMKMWKKIDGTYIDLRIDTINPLEIQYSRHDQLEFIRSILTHLRPDAQTDEIDKAINYIVLAYEARNINDDYIPGSIKSIDFLTVSDVLQVIKAVEIREVEFGRTEYEKNISIKAYNIIKALSEGEYGKYFDCKTTIEFNENDKAIIFDPFGLKGDIYDIMYLNIMNFMMHEMYLNRNNSNKYISFIIEEIHRIADSEPAMKFVDSFFFESRKYNTSLIMTMHNVDQIMAVTDNITRTLGQEKFAGIIKQIPYKFIFKHEKTQVPSLKKLMMLSDDVANQVPQLKQGSSFLLINEDTYRLTRRFSQEINDFYDGGVGNSGDVINN